MKTYAIIKNNVVENIIEYETQPSNPPPGFTEEYIAVEATGVSPGWVYDGKMFTDPNPPVIPTIPPL